MKQLAIGTFFSNRFCTSDLEQNADNNISARVAARYSGFSQQNHSAACMPHVDTEPFARSPLHIEESGSFFSITL